MSQRLTFPPRLFLSLLCVGIFGFLPAVRGEPIPDESVLDRKLMAAAKEHSEVLANLTYLCDEIGPRLTGSKNLKRANEWAAAKMKAYGLTNVHQEAWEMPEGWERGPATMRLIEPDTGHSLSIASYGWTAGTQGKVQGDVVIIKAESTKDLAAYKGKLKNAVVLMRPPSRLMPIEDIDKPTGGLGTTMGNPGGPRRPFDEMRAFNKELSEMLAGEGAAAILSDAGVPFGLLVTTGGWNGTDRPSATNRVPHLFVAHNDYALLYRLAQRPAPAKTRVEVDVRNTFVPGPIAVQNTVGEITGSEKPEEIVVVGAHLDSWDLGQGATDNGTGSTVVLETARILASSGLKPRRTIRFVLFTGEEQGLKGSAAYVERHKDEMPRITAALVHDTGTGKVTGFDARHRPILQPLLAKELASLKEVGLTAFDTAFIGGSDHASFEKMGVPGLMVRQEIAGYRLNHHTQIDNLDRAMEENLIQGAQVMAVSALRLANREGLLPREKPAGRPGRGEAPPKDEKKPDEKKIALGIEDLGKLVGVSDPQIAPDGRSIVIVVSRPNYEKNRLDRELVLVEIATGKQRVLTRERFHVGQPRWSPMGDRLAFLDTVGTGKDAHHQIFVLPMNGGDAQRITEAPKGVQHFAWKPDGSALAYATADEPANKKEIEKGESAFEVGNNDFLTTEAPTPTHVWLVPAEGGKATRLTSGPSGVATVEPPGPPSSPLSWSPDGKSLLIVRQALPHDGDNDQTKVQILDVATLKTTPLTGRKSLEMVPSFSPEGSQVAYWYPRDGDPNNVTEIWVAPSTNGTGTCLTRKLDRCLLHSVWTPDGKALLVGGHDGTHAAFWLYPLVGEPRRLELGRICPTWMYQMDANVGRSGAIAFTGSEPGHPTELYYLASPSGTPRQLTDFNAEVASRTLGKVETMTWKVGGDFEADGIVTYPPDFNPEKKYPLVLLIHGGPQSASVERFDAWAQLIAATGKVVFQPNYRGSDHLGNAYQRAIVGDWGQGPGEDVLAGVEALKKRGFVDEKRIAVTGWSYGGYMTSWLIGHSNIWKTAIAGAAVTDWIDDYHLSDNNVLGRYEFGGSPWKGDLEKEYRKHSPITYARDIKTPTLIVATTGDARVPITQSYRLYHALKDNNVPVKFIAYPVSGHFPADPVPQKDLYRRWVAYLDEQLK